MPLRLQRGWRAILNLDAAETRRFQAHSTAMTAAIGTLNEGPLHAALKDWYAEPGDLFEVPLEGRHIDIVRGQTLIEIQTGGFSPLRRKLKTLVENHRVRLVHPIPYEKWVVRIEDDDGQTTVLGKRKSRLRGKVIDVFAELVSLHSLLAHPNFSVEVALTQEEEVRRHSPGQARRRKGWVIVERRLLDVVEHHRFDTASDYLALLPAALASPFSTKDLAEALQIRRDLAQKMAYCLRQAGFAQDVGKRGNARLYARP